jgi:uncharacterized membrane protein YkvA (DUF1232 family)
MMQAGGRSGAPAARGWRARLAALETEAVALALATKDPRTPWYAKAVAGLVVAYAFSPIDLIPDFIPVLGLLDDLLLVPLGVLLCRRLVPPAILDDCRIRAREAVERPRSRAMAVAIVMTWIALAVAVGFRAWPAKAQAQPVPAPVFAAGEYLAPRGGGALTIRREGARTSFSLESVGPNAHTCSLEGVIEGGLAKLESEAGPKACVVRFSAVAGGIEVSEVSANRACRFHCGLNAGFEGTYRLPGPECRPAAVAGARREFKRRYDAKDWAGARARLEPVFLSCSDFWDWIEEARVRNDLAVTMHKLGELPRCRLLLDPLAALAREKDDELRDRFAPVEVDGALSVIRATRTNLRLCGAR